jgi:hypothetical protein
MKRKLGLVLIVLLLLSVSAAAVLAAVDAFSLDWWSVDGGGETSTGGGYSMSGIIGQVDAGILSGGGYTLSGGFLDGALLNLTMNYLPFVGK